MCLPAQAGELVTFTLGSGETIAVYKGLVSGGSTEGLRHEISQPVYFDVRVDKPAPWSDLANHWLQPLQALLWLASGRAGEVEGVWVWAPSKEPRENPWKRCLWVPFIRPTRLAREPMGPEVLFRARELPGGFEDGFEAWMALWGDLQHLLGPLYARSLPSSSSIATTVFIRRSWLSKSFIVFEMALLEIYKGRLTVPVSKDWGPSLRSTAPI